MATDEVVERFEALQRAIQRAHEASRRGGVDAEWMAAWSEVFRLQREVGILLAPGAVVDLSDDRDALRTLMP